MEHETGNLDASDQENITVINGSSSTPAVSDVSGDLDEDIVAWLSMDDETVSELMKFLDTDYSDDVSTRVKFIESPYSSPLIVQSSSSYITINGNEESCGSSFSDWESSVMASVDMSGIVSSGRVRSIDGFYEMNDGGMGGAWRPEEEKLMDGCDEIDWDLNSDSLLMFLGGEGFC